MKHLFVIIVALCVAVLALRFFSGAEENRGPSTRGGEEDSQVATQVPSKSQTPAPAGSAAGSHSGTPNPEPARSWWQGFLGWVGSSTKSPREAPEMSLQAAQSLPQNSEPLQRGAAFPPPATVLPFIAGKVMDEAGQPVGGIDITAQPLWLSQIPEGAVGSTPAAQARSDRAGTFRFERLPEGEYRLRTTAADLYLPAEAIVRTGVDSANLVVSRERPLTIQGVVKDNLGNPLQGVRVVASQMPSQGASTDPNGRYEIRIPVTRSSHTYLLKYQLAGYREEVRQLNDSQIYGQSVLQLDANLTPLNPVAVVGGRVVNTAGEPLGGEVVALVGRGRYNTAANEAGEFLIADVESGRYYKLSIPSRPPYRPFTKQVWVGPEGLFEEVVLEAGSGETASLSGRMMDADGNPLSRFSLWLQRSDSAAVGPVQVTSDDLGRYSVREVPLGRLNLTTRSEPRLSLNGIYLYQGGAQNLDLVLDWGGHEVGGRVVDPDGRPVPACRVVLSWSLQYGGLQSLSQRETVADGAGVFRFAQVGPGVHSVSVSVPGSGRAWLDHKVGGGSGPVLVQLAANAHTVP